MQLTFEVGHQDPLRMQWVSIYFKFEVCCKLVSNVALLLTDDPGVQEKGRTQNVGYTVRLFCRVVMKSQRINLCEETGPLTARLAPGENPQGHDFLIPVIIYSSGSGRRPLRNGQLHQNK